MAAAKSLERDDETSWKKPAKE